MDSILGKLFPLYKLAYIIASICFEVVVNIKLNLFYFLLKHTIILSYHPSIYFFKMSWDLIFTFNGV